MEGAAWIGEEAGVPLVGGRILVVLSAKKKKKKKSGPF
jgi:hypothetical protein